eukprot:gnl/TRDRNA2_/TRDRNA2_120620_c0_seq1.p1 gnl/TRDRNA2_/TRDRNA2_120620_c0~~gnl/TRDRNA2_/TRDRNA2_120620_c0_seq1.p1  ORF type:complete len:669 (-),score=96.30 gnl/TRDRNA2_/TRDRNA2_120620_c0_seq1:126-1874(-)
MLRTVDRIRIIYKRISAHLDLDQCVEAKLLNAHYPVHNKAALESFKQEWGSFQPLKIFDLSARQPLQRIRDYFGEEVAFYFVWTGFTIRLFAFLAVGCVASKGMEFGLRIKGFEEKLAREYATEVFAVCMIAWSGCYGILWKRTAVSWKAEWNVMEIQGKASIRPGFRGTLAASPENRNIRSRQYPASWRWFWTTFANSVTIGFMCLVLVTVGYVFELQPMLVERYGPKGLTAASLLITVQIKIYNAIWGIVAPLLVERQNPRTERDYYNLLVGKLFAFQVINAYNSFFYIAFFQKDTAAGCPNDDCIGLLRSSLLTTFGGLCACSVVEMVVPYVQFRLSLYREEQALRAQFEEKISQGLMSKDEMPKHSFMEKQAKMSTYDMGARIDDFNSLMLTVGYVQLFCVVAPTVCLLALLVLALQLRADAWKLCSCFRRPYPHLAVGIGYAWNSVLQFLGWVGTISCVAIPVLNLTALDEIDRMQKMAIFFALEHLAIFLRLCILNIMEEEPATVKLMLSRRRYVKQVLETDAEEAALILPDKAKKPRFDRNKSTKLNAKDDPVEWAKVEKDDDPRQPAVYSDHCV